MPVNGRLYYLLLHVLSLFTLTLCTGSYLASLPKDSEEIVSGYTSSAHQDRNSHNLTFPSPQTPPLNIVVYVLCNDLQSMTRPDRPSGGVATDSADSAKTNSVHEERMVCLKTMKAFSELLQNEEIPTFIRERLVFQVCSLSNSCVCYHHISSPL